MGKRIGVPGALCATIALMTAANVALADDAGVHAFLLGGSGGASPAVPAIRTPSVDPVFRTGARLRAAADRAPTLRYHTARFRPLTVHRNEVKALASAGPSSATGARISIYDDPTLRDGDAVMTAGGIRIFAGSGSLPHLKTEFVTIAEARDLDRDTVKVLASLNNAPPS